MGDTEQDNRRDGGEGEGLKVGFRKNTDQGIEFRESDFMPLDDLVYAPLHALAESNRKLRAQVVETIKSMGTVQQNGTEETIRLNNINIAYDQVRPEGDEGYNVDSLQVQVPLLSIVPITNLNVEKAEIGFSTEVRAEKGVQGSCEIAARICSPEQRESDFLPRVTYKMKVTSLPATEGILRLTDMLSANQIAKKTDTTPVAVDGNLGTDTQKDIWQEVSTMKTKIRKLRQLYHKIDDLIAEQERMQEISRETPGQDIRGFDKDKYLAAQSEIANRILEYREQIMNREIEFGLDNDYK